MAHLCVGEQHEKLGSYNHAIKLYAEGKEFAETNFGVKHPLYTKCINAMGGARLRSKYQTKEVYRTATSSSVIKPIAVKTKGSKKAASKDVRKGGGDKDMMIEEHAIKSKLMARRLAGGSAKGKRRDITGVVKASEVRMSNAMRNHQDNMLLANCDTWTSMHCRHPRPAKRESLLGSVERKRRNRIRSNSVQSERRRNVDVESALSHSMLSTMTDKRAPYKVVCKNGPKCTNHDWSVRSPIKKVCTRGPNCPNHDWDCSLRKSMKFSKSSSKSTYRRQHETVPPLDQIEPPQSDRKVTENVIEVEEIES